MARNKSYCEAAKMVNDHEFGNGAAIFTQDDDAARKFTNQVKASMAGVNVPVPVSTAYRDPVGGLVRNADAGLWWSNIVIPVRVHRCLGYKCLPA